MAYRYLEPPDYVKKEGVVWVKVIKEIGFNISVGAITWTKECYRHSVGVRKVVLIEDNRYTKNFMGDCFELVSLPTYQCTPIPPHTDIVWLRVINDISGDYFPPIPAGSITWAKECYRENVERESYVHIEDNFHEHNFSGRDFELVHKKPMTPDNLVWRMKTKEEFIRDNGWRAGSDCPSGWNSDGKMNYLLGQTITDTGIIDNCIKGKSICIDKWTINKNQYVYANPIFPGKIKTIRVIDDVEHPNKLWESTTKADTVLNEWDIYETSSDFTQMKNIN